MSSNFISNIIFLISLYSHLQYHFHEQIFMSYWLLISCIRLSRDHLRTIWSHGLGSTWLSPMEKLMQSEFLLKLIVGKFCYSNYKFNIN